MSMKPDRDVLRWAMGQPEGHELQRIADSLRVEAEHLTVLLRGHLRMGQEEHDAEIACSMSHARSLLELFHLRARLASHLLDQLENRARNNGHV